MWRTVVRRLHKDEKRFWSTNTIAILFNHYSIGKTDPHIWRNRTGLICKVLASNKKLFWDFNRTILKESLPIRNSYHVEFKSKSHWLNVTYLVTGTYKNLFHQANFFFINCFRYIFFVTYTFIYNENI